MTDFAALRSANAKRWANARLTRNFSLVAKHLVIPDVILRYQAVAAKTGVPWAVIAVIHERESSQDWAASLAQGDPWNRVSVHVPKGRGPFKSWEEAAIDALLSCPPFAARNKDWSIGGTLALLETYNGTGYAKRGMPSPYIWAGTDQYKSGKYIRDGVFDPDVVDSQLGCAGLLMAMMTFDSTITFSGVTIDPYHTPIIPQPTAPSFPKLSPISSPATGLVGAVIASAFSTIFSIFKRK